MKHWFPIVAATSLLTFLTPALAQQSENFGKPDPDAKPQEAALAVTVAEIPKPVEIPELVARAAVFEQAKARAMLPVLGTYLRDLQSLKRTFTQKGALDPALAVDAKIREVTAEIENATILASGKPLMDKMAIFIWGVKDPQQIPAERKVKYQDVTIGMSNEITFKKDGTFVRGDNSGGTWRIENGRLTTVLHTTEGKERAVFSITDLKDSGVKGKILTGQFADDELLLTPVN